MINNTPKTRRVIIKRRLHFISIGLILCVFTVQLITACVINSGVVHAAEELEPKKLAQIWNAGMALANCSRDAGWDSPQTASDLNNGGLFTTSTDLSDWNGDPKEVGIVVDPDDGQIKCDTDEEIVDLFEILDVKPIDFLRDANIYKINSDHTAYEVTADNDTLGARIKNYIENKYGINYSGGMPKASQYAALLDAFNKQCKQDKDDNGTAVKIVNKEGVVETIKYSLNGGANDVINIGYSIDGHGGDQQAACPRIVELMSDTAQAYADRIIELGGISGDTDESAGETKPSCESEGGSMSWIMCSIIDLGDKTMRVLDDALISLLTTPNEYLTDPGLRKAWANLRNLAYLILVPVTLVMLIGTAMGFDFVSAYTVKRALPRLLVATIFIALSFDIAKFLILLTNGVGTGIYGMITSAVTDQPITLASIFAPSQGTGVFAVGGFVLAAGSALALGSIGVILSYLFVALLGLGIGFFLLALRQFIIIALMILAPVAILSWIFPGNDKLWKLWWQSFSKLLMLFPLIMLLIAVGRAFAVLVSNVH
ncbi:hypothetical protein KC968_02455 [Candidatus Saccharibacteria bacterium]|nr:hypothetical protein [Candidatus Saccharibacteria bacterium]